MFKMNLVVALGLVVLAPSAQAEAVVWSQFYNGAKNSGTTLVSGAGYGAGARSKQVIGSGAGSATVKVISPKAEVSAGLNFGALAKNRNAIEHALTFNGAGTVEVWESGAYRGETKYALNDKFQVKVSKAGVVSYWKNGALFYKSSKKAVYPLYLEGIINPLNSKLGTAGIVPSPLAEPEPSPDPTPDPTPTPPPSDLPNPMVINEVGPALSPTVVEAMGPAFAKYEQNFRSFAETHWAADGANWEKANYYDRAKIYYVWWARTGNSTYLNRANALILNYRTNYLEANNYGASAHWVMPWGLLLHYKLTGDSKSQRALGALADGFAASYYMDGIVKNGPDTDPRIQSRMLLSFLYAWETNAASIGVPNIQPNGEDWGVPGGNNWANLLRTTLNKVLAAQEADGSYRVNAHCGFNTPFMVGLLNDALIEYYTKFEKDPRILPAIKKSLDYMWAKNWNSSAQAFQYLGGNCGAEGGTEAAPDLNNMILPGFGFVYAQTGDATYKTRGDAVLTGGVNGAWLEGGKQFNESYTNSYKYMGYRAMRP